MRKSICQYRTEQGAARYARDLAALYPKRQFRVEIHPWDFGYTVTMHNDSEFVSYVAPRKGVPSAKPKADRLKLTGGPALSMLFTRRT